MSARKTSDVRSPFHRQQIANTPCEASAFALTSSCAPAQSILPVVQKNRCICCWNSHGIPACKHDCVDRFQIVTPPEFSRTPIASLLTAASAATGGRGSRMKAPALIRLQIAMNSFGRTSTAAVFPSPSALSSLRVQQSAQIRHHPESQTGSHCPAGNTAGCVKSFHTKPLSNQATLPVCSI